MVAITLSLLLSVMVVSVGGETIEKRKNVGRNELDGDYVLMSDLEENTSGYDGLVDTENGWDSIGEEDNPFIGAFDENEHDICDLFLEFPQTFFLTSFSTSLYQKISRAKPRMSIMIKV